MTTKQFLQTRKTEEYMWDIISAFISRAGRKTLDNSSYRCPPIGSINGTKKNVAICLSSVHSACQIKDCVER